MKIKKLSITVSILIFLSIVLLFCGCSQTNFINGSGNNFVDESIDNFVSIYPEEEKAIDATIKVETVRYNWDEGLYYHIEFNNILPQDIIGRFIFYLSDGTVSSRNSVDAESNTLYSSSVNYGFGSRSLDKVHIRIEQLVDSCERATKQLRSTIETSYYPYAVDLAENKIEYHNRRNQLIQVKIVLQYPNGLKQEDIFYITPHQMGAKTYKGPGKATFDVQVIAVGNASLEKEMEETMKVSYKTLPDGKIENTLSFYNVLNKSVQFEIVRTNGITEESDYFTHVGLTNRPIICTYIDSQQLQFKIKVKGF